MLKNVNNATTIIDKESHNILNVKLLNNIDLKY